MATKLLLIHDKVKDYQTFIDAALPDTECIVLGSRDLPTDFNDKVSALNITDLTNIGLVFDNTGDRAPFFEYTTAELEEEQRKQEEYQVQMQKYSEKLKECKNDHDVEPEMPTDPVWQTPVFIQSEQFFSDEMMTILRGLKEKYTTLAIIDIISCNIQENQQFKLLKEQCIDTRYSTNITGASGDWILESHNVNVTPIYFTDTVKEYKYKLGGIIPPLVGGVYQISTPDHLYYIMTSTSVPFLSSSFQLMNDINMTAFTSESIGKTTEVPFGGIFNGASKTITIGSIVSTYIGLFGNISNTSNISYINLEYNTLNITTANITVRIGSFCGFNNGIISNSNVIINGNFIINSTNSSTLRFGGFCGWNSISSSMLKVKLIINGDFIVNHTNNTVTFTGGFSGANFSSISEASLVINGNTIINDNSSYQISIGGFCGSTTGNTIDSSWTYNGDITVIATNINSYVFFGGFSYNTGTTTSNCIGTINGNISITSSSNEAAIGGFYALSNLTHISTLSSSITYNGTILFNIEQSSILNSYIGGFTGRSNYINDSKYTNCIVNYNGKTIFRNKGVIPYITSFIGNLQLTSSNGISTTFFGTPFIFYIDTANSIVYNGTTYTVPSQFIVDNKLNVIVDDLTVTIEQYTPFTQLPPPPFQSQICVNPPYNATNFTPANAPVYNTLVGYANNSPNYPWDTGSNAQQIYRSKQNISYFNTLNQQTHAVKSYNNTTGTVFQLPYPRFKSDAERLMYIQGQSLTAARNKMTGQNPSAPAGVPCSTIYGIINS